MLVAAAQRMVDEASWRAECGGGAVRAHWCAEEFLVDDEGRADDRGDRRIGARSRNFSVHDGTARTDFGMSTQHASHQRMQLGGCRNGATPGSHYSLFSVQPGLRISS